MTYPTTLAESLAVIDSKIGDSDTTGVALQFDRLEQAVVSAQVSTSGAGGTTCIVSLYQSTGTDFSDLTAATVKAIADKSYSFSGSPASVRGMLMINLKAEELDTAGGYKYWTLDVNEVDANTTEFCVNVFGADAKYGPASDQNMTSTTHSGQVPTTTQVIK